MALLMLETQSDAAPSCFLMVCNPAGGSSDADVTVDGGSKSNSLNPLDWPAAGRSVEGWGSHPVITLWTSEPASRLCGFLAEQSLSLALASEQHKTEKEHKLHLLSLLIKRGSSHKRARLNGRECGVVGAGLFSLNHNRT